MYIAECTLDGQWKMGSIQPYGNISVSPSAAVLNYGQGIFEGMKAFRTPEDEIVTFRPDENAKRFAEGAGRMSMPPVPKDIFEDAVKKVISANSDYVPPVGIGSLYIRPLLIGTGAILGLGPAPSYTFLVYVSPVASYFKGGQLSPIDLVVEEDYHRAAPGGTGSTKCVGNYSPVLKVQLQAKKRRIFGRYLFRCQREQVHRRGVFVQLFRCERKNHRHAGAGRNYFTRYHEKKYHRVGQR